MLTTDTGSVGAISPEGTVVSNKPIVYASRTRNFSEKNWSAIEEELLAIIWGTKQSILQKRTKSNRKITKTAI